MRHAWHVTSAIAGFDPARYARRLDLARLPEPTLAGVRRLVAAHALAIPFENLDAVLGRGVDLSPEAVFAKLVEQRRGGWCFEQNLLLGMALRHLGLEVADHAGQVLWFRPPGHGGPRTHRLLLVDIEGRRYVADAGFGAVTLTDVLALEPDVEQVTSHETFRFIREGAIWRQEVRLRDEWRTTYRFDLCPWWPDDFAPVNYQLAHDPKSQFVQAVNLARVLPQGRLGLRDAEFTRRAPDGTPQTRTLRDVDEMLGVIEGEFGIEARALPGIEERLAQCFVPPPASL